MPAAFADAARLSAEGTAVLSGLSACRFCMAFYKAVDGTVTDCVLIVFERAHVMTEADDGLLEQISALKLQLDDVREMISRRIIGQERVVDLSLISMLCGGHALLFGVPGLGKTRLVETLSVVMGLESSRIQCTPDLMPADILGSEILQQDSAGRRSFEFVKGPVFCQLLMADEINRASPRTQSALLQAMEENTVSIANAEYALPQPFLVLATQNPIELEGTYRLPEAQLDRFLMRIEIGNPDREAERAILEATTGPDEEPVAPVLDSGKLLAAQRIVRKIPVGESVMNEILSLVRGCRPENSDGISHSGALHWGPGVRASQALIMASRARALLRGELAPGIDDVHELAAPVLAHRMNLKFSAQAQGVTPQSVIDDTLTWVSQ